MKGFVFDRLVDRENLCDLLREQRLLREQVNSRLNSVVYAPRSHGKTSVVRNIVMEDFRKAHRRSFVYFADLLGVRNRESLTDRLTAALERSFEASFPVKTLLEGALKLAASMRPELSVDPATGSPKLSLRSGPRSGRASGSPVWESLTRICRATPSLVVLDEFQDIARVDEGPSLMRSALEGLGETPVIVMGSKQHMLADIFARPQAALAGWGSDIEFHPIPYEAYHVYIEERFRLQGLRIAPAVSQLAQDLVHRVPEAVNRLCHQVMELYQDLRVTETELRSALESLLIGRQSRYEVYLTSFSATDERVLCEIARAGSVARPHAKDFLAATGFSNRTAGVSIRRLLDRGVVEASDRGYRLSDPLLEIYLTRYR